MKQQALELVGRVADAVVVASAPAAVSWLTVPAAWMKVVPPREGRWFADEVQVPAPLEVPGSIDPSRLVERWRSRPDDVPPRLLGWQREWTPASVPSGSPLRLRPAVVVRHWGRPAPTAQLLVVSGFNMGWGFLDAEVLRLRWFAREGYSVTLLGLPLHGSDALTVGPPAWPSVDFELTRDAVACATHDVRQTVAWLRASAPAPVVVLGVSLGAWPAALSATLPHPPDVFAALTPMVDYPALLQDHRPFWVSRGAITRLSKGLEPVSALHRPSTLAPGRALVLSAASDRVTLAANHAVPLARHFGGRSVSFPGSHLVPHGLGSAWRQLDAFVDETVGSAGSPGPVHRGETRA